MRQLNISSNRLFYIGRVLFLFAFVAVSTIVVTRSGFTSTASTLAMQGGCTTNPVVANNLDSGAGSLRQAIADACADSTITFNMATVTSPITLTTAELLIQKNLTITGPGATTLTIARSSAEATPHFRIFRVTSDAIVSISGLTMTNGRAPDGFPTVSFGTQGGSGGAIHSTTSLTLSDVHLINNRAGNGTPAPAIPGEGGDGGAVYAEVGPLSITNSTISGNTAGTGGFNGIGIGGANGGSGGGVYKESGTLTLTNVTITNNTAGNSVEPNATAGHGGGVYTNTGVTATLTNCTVSNNSAGDALGPNGLPGFGGGINSDGAMTITGSTISGNTSETNGGGLFSRVSLAVINTTISGNSAAVGGGINSDSPILSLTNSTITNNTALTGAGIMRHNPDANARNTIIAGNVGPQDASGSFVSFGNNIIGNNASTTGFVNGVNGDKVGTEAAPLNPGLAPLANNGGPTQTHALLATSPALDAGNNCVLNNSCFPAIGVPLTLATDQRGAGFTRAADSADEDITHVVDIGAFEARASVEDITDKSVPEDGFTAIVFRVADENVITSVTASSSNKTLVPDANLNVFINTFSSRIMNITPAANQSGVTTITVTVTSGTESMSDTFVLTVTPVNDAPTDIALTNNNVADNSPSNTPIGTFTSTDIDPLQTFTYSLVSGAGSGDNASFSIVGDQLRTASTIDFETKPIFTIRVRSTDGGGLFVEKQFFINVIDGADNPGAISFTSGNFNVGEGDGNANITLRRTGGADNRVVAKVNLADVTTSSTDYAFAPGSLDPTFNSGTGGTSSSNGSVAQFIEPILIQPDGKIVIGGAFLFYNDVPRTRVARINANGTLDASFNPGMGANNWVLCMALQPDGKVLIGGLFTSFDGEPRPRIARLNSNGTLDLTFSVIPNDVVRSIVVQPDGKILIGGDFTSVNGSSRNHIARLNDNGSLDSWAPASGGNGVVGLLALQPDGKIVVGGGFLSFAGADNTRLVRLTSSGALDLTFNTTALGTSLAPHAILLQPDGKILVGGEFIGVDTPFGRQGIARLETNGTIDPTFNPGLGTEGHTIDAMALQPDGKIVITGGFPTFNGTTVNRLARLNSGGSVDSSFNSGAGLNSLGFSVVVQPDGKIIIGGLHTFYNNVSNNGITRINGDLFATWEAGDSANKTVSLPIVDDALDEPNETLSLQVVPLLGATAGVPSSATLTILDNDPSPTAISAVSGSGTFGGTATLTATLTSGGSGLSGKTVSFTLNGTGVGNATTNASGVATLSGVSLSGINAGSHTNAVGASFAAEPGNFLGSSGTGTLTVAQVSTSTAVSSSVNPSEFGQSVTFTATVTSSAGTPTGTVQFKDGSSNLGSPVTLTAGVAQLSTSSLTSGTHTITAEYSGSTNFISSTGNLSGGQVVKPQPAVTINDVSIAEGHGGTTNLVFTVTLSAASALTVNVNFATADGTATTSDSDYQSANGTLTFNPGDLSKTVTVLVNGDLKTELDETVFVNLNNPVNVAVTDAQGAGTILNDDTLQLVLDESGPAVDQAAALESMLLLRDPFKVLSVADWLDLGADRNTRVIIFAANLQGNLTVIPSVTVSLVDGNNQTHEVPAEDVRPATHPDFMQVVFRLPNGLAPGVCHVTMKSHGRTSNTGTIRIAAP